VDINNVAFAEQCFEIMNGQDITNVTEEERAFVRLVDLGFKNESLIPGLTSYLGLLYSGAGQPSIFVQQLAKMDNAALISKAQEVIKKMASK